MSAITSSNGIGRQTRRDLDALRIEVCELRAHLDALDQLSVSEFRGTDALVLSLTTALSTKDSTRTVVMRTATTGPDITTEDAAHVLWLLTSFDGFDALFTGRGLSLEAVVEVLTAMAERSLYR